MKLTDCTDAERASAVATFDARFGEMERVLWCLSVNSRPGLLAGESSPALEALVWTVKSRWGVQGVRAETKGLMAVAVAETVTWSPDLFGPVLDYGPGRAGFACDRVAEIVRRSMSLGVPRREYSLASRSFTGSCPGESPSTTASSVQRSACRRRGITPRPTARSPRTRLLWPRP